MRLSVVIPVRDDVAGLSRALAGLGRQTMSPDEIIVVDAGTSVAAATMPQRAGMRILTAGPAFPGAARNCGAEAARSPWVAFLDAGTEPTPGWIEAFRHAASARPQPEVIFGTYEPRIVDDWDWAAEMTYLAPPTEATGGRYPTSASICIRKETWFNLGGMRGDLRAGEDLLFFDAIALSGVRAITAPAARVVWDLPRGAGGHFRRLHTYSQVTWTESLARRWQRPLLRMYGLGLAFSLGAFAAYPPLLFLVPLLAAVRFFANLRERQGPRARPYTPSRVAKLVAMALIVDAATLTGVCASLLDRQRSTERTAGSQ